MEDWQKPLEVFCAARRIASCIETDWCQNKSPFLSLKMKKDHVSDLITRLESGYFLPSLSIIAMKLIEMASDDRCSIDDLANLVERDPSLAVRLLRLANSAFFQPSHPVTTLKQAILRIGFDRLRIMALSLSLEDTFQSLSEEKEKETLIAHALQAVVHEIRNPLMASEFFVFPMGRISLTSLQESNNRLM